ncbi:hypothetical protein HPB47_022182 [Ixodes persulcatus]|uniref:Uncharacterized protein n=1 Tax=Ixodes persulcatus TaxID=34615 RepID=A0AC60QAD1_IXOPE|nr:hypothetical protein HPB47_022182 [Ixodes persulcatus]
MDAALYTSQAAVVASVIDSDFDTVVTTSVRTIQLVMAEEVGITLASSAITGRVFPQAFCILRKSPNIPSVEVAWTHGHKSVDENRHAHAVTPACILRAASREERPHLVPNQYSEILSHLRGQRQLFPLPDRHLSQELTAAWRQIQSNLVNSNSRRTKNLFE